MTSTNTPPEEPSPSSDLEKHEQQHQSSTPSPEKTENGVKLEPATNEDLKPAPPKSEGKEPEWLHGFKLFTVMAAVTFVCFLMLLDSSIVVTAVPRITNDFHSLPDVGWYGSAYQLGSAALQPLTGKVYMKFNVKWTFLFFFFIFEVGSLICAVATSSKMLIVGRAVAGMGTSGIMNGAMVIIAMCAPMQRRPSLIGFTMGLAQIGLVSGPLFGGLLTEFATWRWCFYINLPIGGIIAVMLIFVRIPEHFPKPPPMSVLRSLPSHFDLIGFTIFAPAAIMLLLALQYGGTTFTWHSPQIIGLFCGAGGTFIVFLIWDWHKGDAAMIPFSMVRQRIVWASCMVYGLFMGQLYSASYWVPIYFQGVKGASPTMSGVYILPMIIAHILSAMSSGPILGRVGYYIPLSLFAAVLICVGSGLISTFSADTSVGKWIGYQIILGVGRGLGLQMPIIAVQNTVAPAQLPIAMALVMFSQSIGAAVILSLCETIFTNSFKTLIPKYAPGVDAQSVINAGATGFRSIIFGADRAGVIVAYAKSVDRIFYLTAGLGVAVFGFAWGMGWKDLRKKKEVSKA